MDYNKILSQIFSANFDRNETNDFVECLEVVNRYLDEKLENFEEKVDERRENEVIAPTTNCTIVWDNSDNFSNIAKLSKDRLSITSLTAFSSLKANACLIGGKYMYEVQLRSKGVMQIGFCSAKCEFTQGKSRFLKIQQLF